MTRVKTRMNMKKFLVTESEIKDIKSLYKSKGIILKEEIYGVVPNWEVAKKWILAKNERDNGWGDWPEKDPEYHYAKYLNDDNNFMEIQSNGNAQEVNQQYQLVHKGTWKWNGKEVVFSWLAKNRAGDIWQKAKKRLETNGVDDYKLVYPNTPWDQTRVKYDEGEWKQGGYNYAKLSQGFGDYTWELEIRDNFTWREYNRTSGHVDQSAKWSWDGSKIIFSRGTTKRASGILSNEDTDLKTAIMVKNKIGRIGSKGPAVKQLQSYLATYYNVFGLDKDSFGVDCENDAQKCDGIYGPKTKEAVKKFQHHYGAKEDGIFGKESYRHYDTPDFEESDID